MIPGDADSIKADELLLKRRAALRGLMLLCWTVLALLSALFWLSITCCMCGHSNPVTAAGVGPALLSCLWGQWKAGRVPAGYLIASWLFLAALLLLSWEVIADILWFGHAPLLP
jgi:hypothetical protein